MARQPASRLGAGSTLELAQHPFFADLDFELLMQRKVPVPMEKPNCASLEVQKDPGMPKSFQRSDGGVAGWDFEACQMDSCPVRPRPRRRLRICGLRW
ncbi:unnamed protein product [Effrenium voratum]|nr:unnamed protein product [Effrenium voratum]CAJ1448897.1 unnamed protein product [Effrenium voratum]